MEIAAFIVSLFALVVACLGAYRSQRLARQANTLPALVDLFREHRGSRLAAARTYVQTGLPADASTLSALPTDERELVRELMWFYDNLGALIAHDIVDAWPVAGYLGGSVVDCWNALENLIEGERERRSKSADKERWQMYFQNMAVLISTTYTPEEARRRQPNWRLLHTA